MTEVPVYTLDILGDIDLRSPDGARVGSVLSQPKRLALLVALAMAAPGRLQRDEVIGLLWPERSQDQARHALRQSLHYLRRSLGPGAIVGKNRDGIGVSPEILRCDAVELLAAAAEGRHGDVLTAHTGDLLPGFHLDDAPRGFEEWLRAQRERIGQAVADAAWAVAEAEADAGNDVAAGAAARRAVDAAGLDEAAVQRGMRLLARIGDSAGALEAYEEFAERARSELDTEPAPATTALAREIRTSSAGEREEASSSPAAVPAPVGAPESVPGPPKPMPVPAGVAAEPAGRRRWTASAAYRTLATAASTLVVAVAFLSLWGLTRGDGTAVAGAIRPTVFLEPVTDLGFPEPSGRLASALTAELAAQLMESSGYRVVMAGPDLVEVGRYAVQVRPSVSLDGDDVRLSAMVLDPRSGAVLETVLVRAKMDPGHDSPEALAGRLSAHIRARVGEVVSMQRLTDGGASPAALEPIRLAAREARLADSLRVAQAWSAAAQAYEAADSLLRLASEAEPGWAEPLLRRGELGLSAMWLDLTPPNADREAAHGRLQAALDVVESAVRLDPDDPRALEVRGVLRDWAARTAPDRALTDELTRSAEADLNRAVSLDGSRARAWAVLSNMAERRGDFLTAYKAARRAFAADHHLEEPATILVRLFESALEVGDEAGARGACEELHQRLAGHWLSSYCDLYLLAWTGPWSAAEADSLVATSAERVPAGPLGRIVADRLALLAAVTLARAGESDRARAALSQTRALGLPGLERLATEAWVHSVLGEDEEARALLATVAERHPTGGQRFVQSQRFAHLAEVRAGDR